MKIVDIKKSWLYTEQASSHYLKITRLKEATDFAFLN